MLNGKVNRRDFLRLSATAAVGTALAACASPAAAPTAAPDAPAKVGGGTLVYGYPQKTTYGDFCTPWFYAGTQDLYSYRLTYSGLLQWSKDFGSFVPDLAESYEFEGNTCTFHLRKNAVWHDGAPFSAKDVMFTYRVIGLPGMLWTEPNQMQQMIVGYDEFVKGEADEITGIKMIDDYTVVFELLGSFRKPFLATIAEHTIIPEHILGALPDEELVDGKLCETDWALTDGIGTGPFKVAKYEPDQFIEYVPNEDYFRPLPLLDKLVYTAYTDMQAQTAALESGECHVGGIGAADYERFSKMDHVDIVLNPGLSNHAFFLNVTQLEQPVRQAMWYALDMDAINQLRTQRLAPIPEVAFEYGTYGVSPDAKKYTFDPEKAKELLAEGNWDPDRVLRFLVPDLTPVNEPFYELCRSYWADVGIKSDYIVAGNDYGRIETEADSFDLLFSGQVWGAVPSYAMTYFDSHEYATFVDIPEGIETVTRISQTEDEGEIKQGVWRMQELVNESAHIIPTNRAVGIYVVNKKVQGDIRPIYALWTRNDWEWENIWIEE